MPKRKHRSPSGDSVMEQYSNKELLSRILKLEKKIHKKKHRDRSRAKDRRSRSPSHASSSHGRVRSESRSAPGNENRRSHGRPSRRRFRSPSHDSSSHGRSPSRSIISASRISSEYEKSPRARNASSPDIRNLNDSHSRGYSTCRSPGGTEVALDKAVHSRSRMSPSKQAAFSSQDHNCLIIENDENIPEELSSILGENPTIDTKGSFALHDAIRLRWDHILKQGLSDPELDRIKSRCLKSSNLNLEAPVVNPEISTILSKPNLTRDASHSSYQNQLGLAMAELGRALNLVLEEESNIPKQVKNDLLQNLSDSGRMLASLFHNISCVRRTVIYPLLNKNMKDLTEKTQPFGGLLFGPDLPETIKTAKQLDTAGKELKALQPQSKFKVLGNFFHKKEGGRFSSSVQAAPPSLNRYRPVRRIRTSRDTKPKGQTSKQDRTRFRRRY
ncbi:hypothetical protein PPYR_15532 [Photinus pyralis]|uniref:Uncharacterized protein n=1 Tax=Photinus pyralis TaxID=7054 RepID=A0A1Y1K6J2_PHOPY|nr:uncharacterized protein LOC116182666 [Photinus pyralis]KAB0790143.1 hypothetical protein PPYR_15532 [Photinus pyralis]